MAKDAALSREAEGFGISVEADCKSVHPGSIPGVASSFPLKNLDNDGAEKAEHATNAERAGTKSGTPKLRKFDPRIILVKPDPHMLRAAPNRHTWLGRTTIGRFMRWRARLGQFRSLQLDRNTVSSLLSRFKREGVVEHDGRRYRLREGSALPVPS
jgi:hypothetical protein